MKKTQNRAHEAMNVKTNHSSKSMSLCDADKDTINKAVKEYLENGYSYPLFAPGCGCD